MALETKRSKFTSLALNGMHVSTEKKKKKQKIGHLQAREGYVKSLFLFDILQRVIKDERFSVGIEPEDDSLWLPAQLLRTTSSILVQNSTATEDVLVNILRLFLSMACSPSCTLNGRLLIEILSKCGKI